MGKPSAKSFSYLLATLCCTLLGSATSVFAQAQHGVSIFKQCGGAVCVGETTTCEITVAHADQLADTTNVVEAFDIVDVVSAKNPAGSNIRIPASGNLPIVLAAGNTTCTAGGSLPCLIGPAGSTLSGLPGVPQAGVVTFRSVYTIQADDPDPLPDQGTVRVRDLCDSPTTTNCSTGISTVQFTAATQVTRCDDGDTCTDDSCLGGVCSFDSVCDDPSFSCDDGDVCTTDVCNNDFDLQTPCCSNDPIVCPPLPCQRLTGCDPVGGCQYTFDCREPAAPGATCCPDEVGCLIESCDPTTGLCGSDPLCPVGDICCADGVSCDDGDGCTEDVCEEGCCIYRPITCDDGDACTNESCVGGVCSFESVCDDPSFSCDDEDICTTDVCNNDLDLQTPCCSNDPIVCPPLPCQRVTGCDPIGGCQYTFDCREPATPGATCCPDEVGCLVESCDLSTGLCDADPLCPVGETCCADGASCDDGDVCTEDVCEEGCCENRPITCDDGIECTRDECTPDGCIHNDDECGEDIPTTSQWGLVVLALCLLIASKLRFRLRIT